MVEDIVRREIPRYVDVLKWTGLGLVALGTAGVVCGYVAKPFEYGIVNNGFVLGASYWIGGGFGLTTLSIAAVQYKTEIEKRQGGE